MLKCFFCGDTASDGVPHGGRMFIVCDGCALVHADIEWSVTE